VAREVKIPILGDSREFDRAVMQAVDSTDRLERALEDVSSPSRVTNAGHLRTQFDDLDTSVRRTGDTVDRTGSVFANFAGNAVQDIPGISGSFGALNVAAGQFAEYATEGGIGLRQMAMAAAPIAIATFAISKFNEEARKAAETRAFKTSQVEAWAKAIREGSTAMEALAETAREAGKLELALAFLGKTDILPALGAAGLTMGQFIELTQSSDKEIGLWREEMEAAGVSAETMFVVLSGVDAAQEQAAASAAAAAAQTKVLGRSEEETAYLIDKARDAHDRNRTAMERRRAEIEETSEALRNQFDHEQDVRTSLLDAADAIDEWVRVQGDAEASDRDRIRATEDTIDSIQAYGEAVRVANDDASTDMDEGAQAQIESLMSVAATLDPESPLRKRLDEYIWILANSIPERVSTTLELNTVLRGAAERLGGTLDEAENPQPRDKGRPINVTVNGVGHLEVAREVERAVAWAVN
jgi:hypothetical protein